MNQLSEVSRYRPLKQKLDLPIHNRYPDSEQNYSLDFFRIAYVVEFGELRIEAHWKWSAWLLPSDQYIRLRLDNATIDYPIMISICHSTRCEMNHSYDYVLVTFEIY